MGRQAANHHLRPFAAGRTTGERQPKRPTGLGVDPRSGSAPGVPLQNQTFGFSIAQLFGLLFEERCRELHLMVAIWRAREDELGTRMSL